MQTAQNKQQNCLTVKVEMQRSLQNLSETPFISLFSRYNKERLNGLPI